MPAPQRKASKPATSLPPRHACPQDFESQDEEFNPQQEQEGGLEEQAEQQQGGAEEGREQDAAAGADEAGGTDAADAADDFSMVCAICLEHTAPCDIAIIKGCQHEYWCAAGRGQGGCQPARGSAARCMRRCSPPPRSLRHRPIQPHACAVLAMQRALHCAVDDVG